MHVVNARLVLLGGRTAQACSSRVEARAEVDRVAAVALKLYVAARCPAGVRALGGFECPS
eukprot:355369-Chlamydomonas_euryale.AAC.8